MPRVECIKYKGGAKQHLTLVYSGCPLQNLFGGNQYCFTCNKCVTCSVMYAHACFVCIWLFSMFHMPLLMLITKLLKYIFKYKYY